MVDLTLLVPGLLGPDQYYADDYVPQLPALERMLACADHEQYAPQSFHRLLSELVGLDLVDGKDVPVGAVTRLVDDNMLPQGYWMRADPVHLRPDRDGLILMDSFVLGLNRHDALAIAAEIKKILPDYDMNLEVPSVDRWYVSLNHVPNIRTTDLSMVVGRDINAYLPQGADAMRFHSLLNQIQMQLHSCDINQLRSQKSELQINSVWFWGAGELPDNPGQLWSAIYSEDVFARGLAMLTDTPCRPPPADMNGLAASLEKNKSILLVLDHCLMPAQYQNLQLWYEALLLLEKTWFIPLLSMLKWGKLKKLTLVTDTSEFEISWLTLCKMWRKSKSIARYKD